MAREDIDTAQIEEQLADAQAQIETLQTAAADAEARAATVRAELDALREEHGEIVALAVEVEAQRDAARSETEALRGQVREAAVAYRTARLASAPDVPHDLVAELDTIEDIDREFEAAQRVVGLLRERLQHEALEERRATRVPVGGGTRRAAPDTSSLSAGEKIRLGLQQLSEREGM